MKYLPIRTIYASNDFGRNDSLGSVNSLNTSSGVIFTGVSTPRPW